MEKQYEAGRKGRCRTIGTDEQVLADRDKQTETG
jgi:hypothetical protein